MTIRAILFDAVGTLIHAEPTVVEVYAEFGAKFRSRFDSDEIASRFSESYRRVFVTESGPQRAASHDEDYRRWREVVADVFNDVDPIEPLFDELWTHFGQPHSWRLFPDAEPAWREVERRGVTVGIASNFDDRLLNVVAGIPLFSDCCHVFHSAGIGYAKPAEEFFREIESRLELAPREILLIGDDRLNDCQGATAAGWQAIQINRAQGESLGDLLRETGG